MDDLTGRPDDRDRTGEASPPDAPGSLHHPPGRFARLGVPVAIISLMVVTAILAIAFVGTRGTPTPIEPVARPDGVDLVIDGAATQTWDPARAGDAGSASLLAQVWEGLTTWDQDGRLQPALARDWDVSREGLRLTFRLRPGSGSHR